MAKINPVRRVLRLKKATPTRQSDEKVSERIPPGQYLTEKFPVLTFGATPRVEVKSWRLKLFGEVESPLQLSWDEFLSLPTVTVHTDIHCVTRWSKLDTVWEGVPFAEIIKLVKPKPQARFVMQYAEGDYSTNLPLEELLRENVILAYRYGGQPLEPDHGGPLRMVVPHLYFWKSAKWLTGLEFMTEDRPGFWERYGYHNHGDPWKEERFG